MEKSYKKFAPKGSPRPLFYFSKQPKTAIACKKFLKFKNILKGDNQKPLKKLTLFFLLNLVSFHGQSYQTQKGPGTRDQSLLRLKNKFTKNYLLVIYYLTKFDDVI